VTGSSVTDYLPGMSIEDFEKFFVERFPAMAEVLWLLRPGAEAVIAAMCAQSNEFESDETGRGDSFRQAHERSSVKATGMSRLLELATNRNGVGQLPAEFRLLDVLGGDGTLARVTGELARWRTSRDWILTGDVTAGMVRKALDHGQPAIRQPAQFLLCRDASFDAVLLAYGTHHIPIPERQECYREALRVLKPGGRLIVHDFEIGSAMARWFEEVVDTYSPTGHKYTHFTRENLTSDLEAAGFESVETMTIYDPITVHAGDPDHGKVQLLQYVINAYRLTPAGETPPAADELRAWTHGLVSECLRYSASDLASIESVPPAVLTEGSLAIYQTADDWIAELPRLALVAVGTKAAIGGKE
jgi:SAM-dependent methyltransferase